MVPWGKLRCFKIVEHSRTIRKGFWQTPSISYPPVVTISTQIMFTCCSDNLMFMHLDFNGGFLRVVCANLWTACCGDLNMFSVYWLSTAYFIWHFNPQWSHTCGSIVIEFWGGKRPVRSSEQQVTSVRNYMCVHFSWLLVEPLCIAVRWLAKDWFGQDGTFI